MVCFINDCIILISVVSWEKAKATNVKWFNNSNADNMISHISLAIRLFSIIRLILFAN